MCTITRTLKYTLRSRRRRHEEGSVRLRRKASITTGYARNAVYSYVAAHPAIPDDVLTDVAKSWRLWKRAAMSVRW